MMVLFINLIYMCQKGMYKLKFNMHIAFTGFAAVHIGKSLE